MGSVTTIHQQFYRTPLPPITIEHLDLTSLTTKPVEDLIATLSWGTRLGVAASYGEQCVLEALAFSSGTRVLLVTLDNTSSKSAKKRKQTLKDILCNDSLEKHGFFMERLAAALSLDLGLQIQNAFDVIAAGTRRGSMAAYKAILARARNGDSLNESVVESIFTEQSPIPSRKNKLALRAWACYMGVQALPDMPGVIDTSIRDPEARSTYQSRMVFT